MHYPEDHPNDGTPPIALDFECEQHHHSDDAVTMVVSGELDLATSPMLDHALRVAPPRIVLDLRGLTFMDCSSLGLLVAAAERTRATGGRFRVVRGTRIVDRLFAVTGVERRLEMPA
jgi:anti-anti-sigma factor